MTDPRSRNAYRKAQQALKAQRLPCALCGQPIDYTLKYPDLRCYVVDHVIPLKSGGSDTLDNKRAAHRACNSAKAAKPHAAVIRRSGALRGSPPPPLPGAAALPLALPPEPREEPPRGLNGYRGSTM